MRRFCTLLTVLVIVVIGIGFYRGWFTVTGGRGAESNNVDVNLSVDTDKVQADADSVKQKAEELTGNAPEGDSR